jgi:uncharacterized protein DUF262
MTFSLSAMILETHPLRLETRPEARSFAIENLLAQIAQGKIRIPTYQRPLRWKDEDRLRLFDSIYRGFPIGTLLFWKRPGEAEEIHLGRLSFSVEARSEVLWVVDGQQRLVTLADALLAEPLERAIRFDLEEHVFAYGTTAQLPPPRWLPLSVVANTADLLRWAHRYLGEESPLLDLAFETGRRLREYQVPASVVESADELVLREIFDRINSTGKGLSGAEIFEALHPARGARRPSSLKDVVDSLRELGFGTLEPEDVLPALLAVHGKDPAKDFRQISAEETFGALAEVAAVLRRVIVFLQEEASFPHRALLPYRQPLIPLAVFFHHHPEPLPRSRRLLVRWLWRGALLELFRGDVSTLRQALGAVRAPGEEKAVQQLLRTVESNASRRLPALDPRSFNLRQARCKLQLSALASLRPRHLQTGEELDLALLCEQRGGPAVRVAPPVGLGGGLAGRLLHELISAGRLLALVAACRDEQILASHCISGKAVTALRGGDKERFLATRHDDLTAFLAKFFAERAVWDAPDRDRPSLQSLIVEDEE